MQELILVECDQCGVSVKLNGIGSSRNYLQRFITGAVGFVLPFTCRKFRSASDWHDMAVHQGPREGEDFKAWYKRVDRTFYEICLDRANSGGNWFSRPYYRKQAKELFEALQFNDGNGYPLKQCNH